MNHLPAEPSRREFLAALAAVPLAAAACGRAPYNPARFRRPPISPVFLSAATDYAADLADVVARGLRELRVDVAGKRILLKPNLVEYEPGAAINTNPSVIVGTAIAMRRAGAVEVVVGEAPGHQRDTEYLLTATGLADQLREHRITFVDLNVDDVGWRELASNFSGIGRMALPASVLRADLVVSMPKLKTHHWAGMTCAMKNLFGVVPGAVYGWPKNLLHLHGIHGPIVDLLSTIRPGLTIVDGIVGMEGDGPIMGTPRGFGLLAMSTDLVAADATCARVLGFDAVKLPYLRTAGRFLGNLDERRIEQRGEPLARFATRASVLDQFREWQEEEQPDVAHFLNDLVSDPGATWVVTHTRSGAVVVDSLETAFDSASRRRGLLGRAGLPRGAGLVIAPCNAVHTFSMGFPIDVVYLDRTGRVVKTRCDLRARRLSACLKGFAVLELPAGTVAQRGIARGDILTISRREKSARP